jgi:threonine dehydrogenase-like Zn-dependent dehydrogenase
VLRVGRGQRREDLVEGRMLERDVRVETVPDPSIQEPTDAIVRITSTGLCGSDLHLSEVLGAFSSTRRSFGPGE